MSKAACHHADGTHVASSAGMCLMSFSVTSPGARMSKAGCHHADGTHVARSAGMCLMSFSVTSPGARMSKAACHHADGTHVARSAGMCLMSFSVTSPGDRMSQAACHHADSTHVASSAGMCLMSFSVTSPGDRMSKAACHHADGTHVARSAGMCLMSFSVTPPGARMSKAACHHADGTHVARSAGMCLMSFSVTPPGARMSKAACHHGVAVVKGQESYTLYNTSFRNIFNSINALAASKCLDINGEEMAIDVYLGGDYKFVLMVLGMAGATSNHACIYCRVHSNDRGDMAKPEDFYWDDDVVRSMSDISKHAQSNSYGCRSEPLVKLPLTHVVMYELHMMLRITDRLLSNLIEDATDYDDKEKMASYPNPMCYTWMNWLSRSSCVGSVLCVS